MAKKKNTPLPDCASCEHEAVKKVCMDAEGLSSTGCPTLVYNDVLAEADKEYDRSEILEFARQASDRRRIVMRTVNNGPMSCSRPKPASSKSMSLQKK
jgi:hypothetical protein